MNDLFNVMIPHAVGFALAIWNSGFYFEDYSVDSPWVKNLEAFLTRS